MLEDTSAMALGTPSGHTEPGSLEADTKRMLSATGLQKSYGARKVVKSVSLSVTKGEVVQVKPHRFT